MKPYSLMLCLLFCTLCPAAEGAPAKASRANATYSSLSRVWLPPVAQGEAAIENARVGDEQGNDEKPLPDYLRSDAARSLKARRLETLAWRPEPSNESSYNALKQKVYVRLRAARYVVRPARFATQDYWHGGRFDEGFEASRNGRTIAGLWYRNIGYLVLFWGERVPQTAQRKRDDALIKAVATGGVKEVEKLISEGANPDARDYDGKTPLGLAASKKNIEIMRFLLGKGANPNARDDFGNTTLMQATEVEAARLLLDKGANPNVKKGGGYTALILAAERGNEELVRLLLEHKADPNIVNENGGTALSWAGWQGSLSLFDTYPVQYPKVVKLLLEHGADPNLGIESGWNAITLAAQDDRAGVVPMMIKASKDKNALLRATARHGQDAIIKTILENGADINGASQDGVTALMEAARSAQGRTVQLLLEKGADAKQVDKARRNALMWACLPPLYVPPPDFRERLNANFDYIAALLLEKGVDLESRDEGGSTALSLAVSNGHSVAVNRLLARGANVHAKMEGGNTLLHQVAAHPGASELQRGAIDFFGIGRDENYLQIIKDLRKAGVDVNARNQSGQSAATLAAARGNQTLFKALKAATPAK